MGNVALVIGLAVVALTAAGQSGLLGGHDFFLIACAGLVASIFCLLVALEARSRRAALGAAMSALPVALLVYFLLTSEG